MTFTSRYGSEVAYYGVSGFVYGDAVPSGDVLWAVEVDWNRDNAFDGSNEAGRMFGIQFFRGRQNMLTQTGSGYESIAPGKCVIKLRNEDGRYDGWNTASPLYPYVTYGAEVRIRSALQTDSILKPVFFGTITDIRPMGYGRNAYAEIHIEDGGRYLREYTARSPIVTNITPGVAVGNILDAVAWPAHWGRNIDAATDNVNYWWSSGSNLAWTELEDVSQSFLGTFFIKADGSARFIDRNAVIESTVNLSQGNLLKDVSLPQPFVNRRSITRLKVHPRVEASAVVIYQLLGDIPLVDAGATKIIWANYTYDNQSVPASSVAQPIATTDFTMNTNSDGTGSDATASFTVTVYDFGDNAKVTFVNNGAVGAYITKLQIKGDAIYEQNVSDVTYPEDISIVTQPREFVLDQKWQQSVNMAADFALVLGTFLNQLNAFPSVRIEGHADLQFGIELFDIITLDLPQLGLNGVSFRVGGIGLQSLTDTCQSCLTTLYLEPYITAASYWTWPVVSFGTDTIFGW